MRLPTIDSDPEEQYRAVSPVIGVILMVAITVILAAVIGAFVLEIGDQQETAPSTSFDTEETKRFYDISDDFTPPDAWRQNFNLSTVTITHAGGDVLSVSQTDMSVSGAEVLGPTSVPPSYDLPKNSMELIPQPNVCEAAGTNKDVEFTSGESWNALFHGRPPQKPDAWPSGDFEELRDENIDCSRTYSARPMYDRGNNPDSTSVGYPDGTRIGAEIGGELCQGDTLTVVWEASSGGKTQTLQRYTAQQGGDFTCPDN